MHVLAMGYGFENCKPWWRLDLLIKWLFWEGIGVQTSHYFELSMAFDNDLKKFLRLKYVQIEKSFTHVLNLLSQPTWWTNHEGTNYYLMISQGLSISH